ncbi:MULTISPECIES: hypothetical protein [unclassified Mesorhizobium]|uniref:hypothetical protein n=1 Tax=unclassified Mesorhizobium TaxID=325217 RepID=UPI0003CF1227|nr:MULTISPECIES: hypothetical protein [unclassified Mesorhizobium]ESX62383.1 hypothetical protein X760_04535 [Mesorhizobium sp. LSHC422A00]WJI42490.1 hypothetical protein NL532_17510 [Mesorhizobium sp. C120A]WJI55686.1 hypothetical protein NLY33_21115 [Mesorhizobium sp. C432A]WJI63331.1 hypothetical protein NLY43_00645 [Mesorhizobium sp. C416B]WJI69435.1 hypothetical protein NLY36_01110 [Mesorhizobium sp. C399B]
MATMADVRRIAWSLFWRSFLSSIACGFVAGAIVGFVIGFIGGFFGLRHEAIQVLSSVGGACLGLVASFLCLNFFLARSIGKEFKGKRLELAVVSPAGLQGE